MAGEHVLFVDDEEQIRKLLSTYLQRQGYEVAIASSPWLCAVEWPEQRRRFVMRDGPQLSVEHGDERLGVVRQHDTNRYSAAGVRSYTEEGLPLPRRSLR